ncbi:hypothetical protein EDC04DRAFT_1872068 [Pisolithus marmoratus]|nr:hypothetical protein EDC04DRAFT_1872068 [Pisolithus marmoratus]
MPCPFNIVKPSRPLSSLSLYFPPMGRIFRSLAVLVLAILIAGYIHLKPYLAAMGIGRSIESIGTGNCSIVSELQACEKIILHQPSGLLYLACSTLHGRLQWMPAVNRFNASGMSEDDHVAVYDYETNSVTRLAFTGLSSRGGISLHGMDVVSSAQEPSTLYVYLVNHRKPAAGDPSRVGADSVIEVFETRLGDSELRHIRTFESPTVIITPNDVVGSPDGKSVYFTNDHARKSGLKRHLNVLIQPYDTSVGFCHADYGCKFAYRGLHASNGIVKGLGHDNDTYYVADFMLGEITVLKKGPDHTLLFSEAIKTGNAFGLCSVGVRAAQLFVGLAADNLAIDSNGALWVAGLADVLGFISRKFEDPSAHVASTGLRVTVNSDLDSLYGQRYSVDKVFEDSGRLASGITTVVYDSQRERLFMHGVVSTHLTICKL